MSKEVSTEVSLSGAIERVLVQGNLAALNPEQRVEYYNGICNSLGLNPLTRPFDYMNLQGKLTLYAKKDCTDQLRRRYGVSVKIADKSCVNGIYQVTVDAKTQDGREDSAMGAVNIKGLSGDKLANAYMKAETKAKRRVTLSICGLGMLDETETETIPGVREVKSDVVSEKKPPATKVPSNARAAECEIKKDHWNHLKEVVEANGWNRKQVDDIVFKKWGVALTGLKTLKQFSELVDIIKNESHQVVSQTMTASDAPLAAEEDVPSWDNEVTQALPLPESESPVPAAIRAHYDKVKQNVKDVDVQV